MTLLTLIFIVKITVTILLVSIPFLIAPVEKLQKATKLSGEGGLFFRLYGASVTALLVGYSFGIPIAESGIFPLGFVCMGVVSNLLAAIFILLSNNKQKSTIIMGGFFSIVGALLTISLFMKELFLFPLW